jgi:ketosteroid isomerase-like protein
VTPEERVRAYYADLRSGDAELVARHFTEDAVHFYTRRDPDVGAARIAAMAALATEHLEAVWTLENLVGDGDQVAIEWSMAFVHPEKGPLLDRGTEWFRFRDGLICEVRAYYDERGGDLRGFDHAAAGHSPRPG